MASVSWSELSRHSSSVYWHHWSNWKDVAGATQGWLTRVSCSGCQLTRLSRGGCELRPDPRQLGHLQWPLHLAQASPQHGEWPQGGAPLVGEPRGSHTIIYDLRHHLHSQAATGLPQFKWKTPHLLMVGVLAPRTARGTKYHQGPVWKIQSTTLSKDLSSVE